MRKKTLKIHIGLRTIKTAVAVIIAMIITEVLGASDSKLIFAMLGAMAAVKPSFKESVEACLSEVIGVIFGAICGIVLLFLPLPSLVCIGIGIVLIITLYNLLQIRYSPSLPCFILVMLCSTPNVQPVIYATGRIWDTAIGLGVGMLINMLVFPYDNSTKIRQTADALDKALVQFLEDLFDGDNCYPNTQQMRLTIDSFAAQLRIFSNQKLILRLRRQHEELQSFILCEQKVRELLAQMEVLCSMGRPGRLNDENRKRLGTCGAVIHDNRPLDSVTERDVVTNYHVSQILTLRRELLNVLRKK